MSSLESVVKLCVDELRDELARLGLATHGHESELRARLLRAHTNALHAADWPSNESVSIEARPVQNRFAQAQLEEQVRRHRMVQEGVTDVLRDFTASFLPDASHVRTRAGHTVHMKTFVRAHTAAAYVPDAVVQSVFDTDDASATAATAAAAAGKKRRMMDELKDEFSRRQEAQPAARRVSGDDLPPPQLDDNGSGATNMFLSQIHPDMHEEALFRIFSYFGVVESVKVIWPAPSEPRARHTAFVAMRRRGDAEAAYDALSGQLVGDRVMRLDWTKSVAVTPAAPLKLDDLLLMRRLKVPRPLHVFVMPPPDAQLHRCIDETAELVAERGAAFEQHLLQSEQRNPAFAWLFERHSPTYEYYVWRVNAFVRGDSLQRWSHAPLAIGGSDGVTWYPPPAVELRYLSDAAASQLGAPDELTQREREELFGRIAALTPERGTIGMVMLFALEHADKAGDVARCLIEYLLSRRTPLAAKLVTLFVVSDILHNTSNTDVPKAAHYRTEFEPRLPRVMQCLNEALCALTSRISAQLLKDRVLQLLRVWQSWSLFADIYITGLQTTFLAAAAAATVDPELDGEPISADQLPSEFDAHDDRQLRVKCRTMGVPDGTRTDMLARLKIASLVAQSVGVTINAVDQ